MRREANLPFVCQSDECCYGFAPVDPAATSFSPRRRKRVRHGDPVERCDDDLPFASRLMALLSPTSHWRNTHFSEAKLHFHT